MPVECRRDRCPEYFKYCLHLRFTRSSQKKEKKKKKKTWALLMFRRLFHIPFPSSREKQTNKTCRMRWLFDPLFSLIFLRQQFTLLSRLESNVKHQMAKRLKLASSESKCGILDSLRFSLELHGAFTNAKTKQPREIKLDGEILCIVYSSKSLQQQRLNANRQFKRCPWLNIDWSPWIFFYESIDRWRYKREMKVATTARIIN